jgi:hypothetical protein
MVNVEISIEVCSMRWFVIALACGILSLSAGCNKAKHQAGNQTISPKVAQERETSQALGTGLLADGVTVDENSKLYKKLEAELMQLVPANKLTIRIDDKTITGGALPEEGMQYPALLREIITRANQQTPDNVGGTALKDLQDTVADYGVVPEDAAPAPAPAEEEPAAPAGKTMDRASADELSAKIRQLQNAPVELAPKTKTPQDIIGLWKSIAEIKDNMIINHDESYFNTLDFPEVENGIFSTMRQAEAPLRVHFTYTFNSKQGRLVLKMEDGTAQQLLVQQPENNEYELRVTDFISKTITVYRKL